MFKKIIFFILSFLVLGYSYTYAYSILEWNTSFSVPGRVLDQNIPLNKSINKGYVYMPGNLSSHGNYWSIFSLDLGITEIDGDDVSLEFRAQNNPADGGSSAFDMGIRFYTDNNLSAGLYYLGESWASSYAGYYIGSIYQADGELVGDTHSWHTYKIETKNGIYNMYKDEVLLKQVNYTEDLGKLTKIRFATKGSGKIDWVKLYSKGQLVMEEGFDSDRQIAKLLNENPGTNLSNGLVGSWDLNGNANDTSGNGYNGTSHNITWVDSGKGDGSKAASFDGYSSWIDIGTNNPFKNGLSSFTIVGWCKSPVKPGYSNYNGLISLVRNYGEGCTQITFGGAYNTGIHSSYFGISDSRNNCWTGSYPNTVSIQEGKENQWNFIVGIINNGELKFYVDGVLKDTQNVTGINISGGKLQLGFQSSTYSNYFNGLAKDIKIYNRAITDSEIQQLYQGTNQPLSQELINETNQESSNPVSPTLIPQTKIISKENIYILLFGLIIIILLWINGGEKKNIR